MAIQNKQAQPKQRLRLWHKGKGKVENELTQFSGTKEPPSASVLKLFNYKAIDDDKDHLIIARDDSYIDMLNIQGHGVRSLTYDQQTDLLSDYHRFLQVFLPDHKYLITPFPIDTSTQKTFWGQRYIKVSDQLRHETNPIKARQLQTQLRYIKVKQEQNILVEQQLRSEEFFLIIFGKDKESIREERDSALNTGGIALIMNQLTLAKKKEILFRINNLNTEIK